MVSYRRLMSICHRIEGIRAIVVSGPDRTRLRQTFDREGLGRVGCPRARPRRAQWIGEGSGGVTVRVGPGVRFVTEEETAKEAAVAGDDAVAELDAPDEGVAAAEAGETRVPADFLQNKEAGLACGDLPAIRGDHLNGASGLLQQVRRHRGAGAHLKGRRAESLVPVVPPDPGDGTASEPSVAVEDQPVLAVVGHSRLLSRVPRFGAIPASGWEDTPGMGCFGGRAGGSAAGRNGGGPPDPRWDGQGGVLQLG